MKNRVFLKAIYRFFFSKLIKVWALPLFFSDRKSSEVTLKTIEFPSANRIWFHAASVGELESIYPLILSAAESRHELILTVFSPSAKSPLEKLQKFLFDSHTRIVYCGYSPLEGDWGDALKKLKPRIMITAKYEAWPELWVSLKDQNIPLAIVSAQARTSLRVARNICQFLTGGLPQLYLFPNQVSKQPDLRQLFQHALIEVAGDPRWERTFMRSRSGNRRAAELIKIFDSMPRPWGAFGSAWMEDLRFFKSALKTLKGTLWIVPHHVDKKTIQKVRDFLFAQGLKPIQTSTFKSALQPFSRPSPDSTLPQCVLVDEMGFLSELYSAADWGYVGGGFGQGVHSTIEPSIHGIPLAIGPEGVDRFSEIQELSELGQLSVLGKNSDLEAWIEKVVKPLENGERQEELSSLKQRWVRAAELKVGATRKIVGTLEKYWGLC